MSDDRWRRERRPVARAGMNEMHETYEAGACERCLARAWLLARLGPHLELVRNRIVPILALDDHQLIAAVAGKHQDAVRIELARFDAARARERCEEAGVTVVCRCGAGYPHRLRALDAPPAVLHVAGDQRRLRGLLAEDPVAVVGARRASPYGSEVARSLAQGIASAGLAVISGMALGIDSAAHAGALAVDGGTVAVLPAGAEHVYPAAKRNLHARIVRSGAVVSELPPGSRVWRWTFPARNRIVAALSAMTVVVEAGERSGALLTARFARGLGRPLGAVPGRVTSPQAAGANALLAAGAYVVRGVQDVLDTLFGAGVRRADAGERPELAAELRVLLAAIADGHDTACALARAGLPPEQGLAALAALELAGHVRREPGGRFSATA